MHRTPRSPRPSRPHRLRRVAVAGLGVAALAAAPAGAATPDEARSAADRGAAYLATQQTPAGTFGQAFGAEWVPLSLAAAGRDLAGVRVQPDGRSALDAYRTLWTGGPSSDDDWTTPSGQKPGAPEGTPLRPASDYARATLIAHAIGLEPTRLAADQNLVAQLAGIYRGRPAAGETPDTGRIEGNFGQVDAFDGAISSLLALSRTAAPQVLLDTVGDVLRSNQLDNGAWSWGRIASPSERAEDWRADPDTTGQAIAALCDSGVRPGDQVVARALSHLRGRQLPSGGIANDWTPNGNVNTTAATVFALNACGIDPQGPDYTSATGKTPIDFLIAQQLTSGPDAGGFGYEPGDAEANLYAAQEAVRALSGSGYAVAPQRSVAAPKVADGTVVPQALVVDAGIDQTGERDLRVCRVAAPVGATVAELVTAAAASAQPAGCVTGLSVVDGTVRALNGVTGDQAQRTWLARVEAGAPRRAGTQPVCHGQIVSLYVGRAADASSGAAAPCTAPDGPEPPIDPAPQPPSPAQPNAPAPPVAPAPRAPAAAPVPKLAVKGRSGAKRTVRLDRKGRVRITLRCPASAGKRGCWSTVEARATYRATPRGEARNRRVGGRTVRVAAGKARTVTVTLKSALRRDLRRVGSRRVRFVVRTQGDDAAKPSRTVTAVGVRPVARS
jgi:hypothetical protein